MSPRQFLFNVSQTPPSANTEARFFLTANAPSLVLQEQENGETARTTAQIAAINAAHKRQLYESGAPMFEDDLEWAFRSYIVQPLWADYQHEREDGGAGEPPRDTPFGNAPPRPSPTDRPGGEELLRRLEAGESLDPSSELVLFNVIVALEWIPEPGTLRRLQWAFRRASDVLYDVTNGGMAFGQVIFGDSSWMPFADYQIMASNRFLPRSWVTGLLDPKKYSPIRVGRGLWRRDAQRLISWDEPEGYKTLVHEWAHYALGLKDGYLREIRVRNNSGLLREDKAGGARTLVVPQSRVRSESIMATADGNSELSNPFEAPDRVLDGGSKRFYDLYPGLRDRLQKPFAGPGLLPLPLPIFRRSQALAEGRPSERQIVVPMALAPGAPAGQAASDLPLVPLAQDGIPVNQWEIYLLRLDGSARPVRVIAQGEVDAATPTHGFTLLGAEDNDIVVVVGQYGAQLHTWQRTLAQVGAEAALIERQSELYNSLLKTGEVDGVRQGQLTGDFAPLKWKLTFALGAPEDPGQTGFTSPFIDVVPGHPNPEQPNQASVGLMISEGATGHLLSADGEVAEPQSGKAPAEGQATVHMQALDGYVVTNNNGAWVISSFSHGGGPVTAPPVTGAKYAAGAANGEALLFSSLAKEGGDEDPDLRLVTTVFRGAATPAALTPLSPVFSIATNKPLPASSIPTLMIVNSADPEPSGGRLRICLLLDATTYKELPTYFPPSRAFAAALLTPEHAGGLMSDQGPFVGHFVLARVQAGS